MNSRSVSGNLVNFSSELATTLNQLDSKEPMLSFPFDHIYACHSENTDRRQTLHLDKEVEIATHFPLPHEDQHVTQRVATLESQNKKLKELLIYHLDLIQHQNELMSKKDKVYEVLKQENDTLKSKVTFAGIEKQLSSLGCHIPLPFHVPVTSTATSSNYTSDPPSAESQRVFNSINDLFSSEDGNTQLLIDAGLSPEILPTTSLDTVSDLQNFLQSELGATILAASPMPAESFTMIDKKRPKKDVKPIDVNDEPKYTVTTDSGSPKIQRNRRRTTGVGRLNRMPKTKPPKTEPNNIFEKDIFNGNEQSKADYVKSNLTKYAYTTLQERLRLIEPTPSGEDPYQIGEAEMREQSPIPKLMLQKANHGSMRIRPGSEIIRSAANSSSSPTPRRIYDTMNTSSSTSAPRAKRSKATDRFSSTNMHIQSERDAATTELEEEPEIDVVKLHSTDIDWRIFPDSEIKNKPKETSLCDFSYGETSTNLIMNPLDITKMEFPDFFEPSPVNADSSNAIEPEGAQDKNLTEKTKKQSVKRKARTTSLAGGPLESETVSETKTASENKRGRKRLNSTAAIIKPNESQQKPPPVKRARRAVRAKKSPVPGMMTEKLYHTCMGDPDVSWYLGIDPDIKKDDCDPSANSTPNVEVPRWREKPYSSLYSMEGTENLDDKVFEKRHQKLEAEERRQLRWHMRRIREQRHVEKLRQRQRDPWGPSTSQSNSRGEYTVWPQPVRDLQFIEITDTLPVNALAEEVPDLPEKQFGLPWVRTSKALKRSNRSKTLH